MLIKFIQQWKSANIFIFIFGNRMAHLINKEFWQENMQSNVDYVILISNRSSFLH